MWALTNRTNFLENQCSILLSIVFRVLVLRKSPKMLSLDTVEEISDACGAGSNVIFDIIILR
jgi:hypothetical protein